MIQIIGCRLQKHYFHVHLQPEESVTCDYEPVALTVMVTLTGSLSSPGGGAWLVVGVALRGEVVRGEDARGRAKVGPGRRQEQRFSIS